MPKIKNITKEPDGFRYSVNRTERHGVKIHRYAAWDIDGNRQTKDSTNAKVCKQWLQGKRREYALARENRALVERAEINAAVQNAQRATPMEAALPQATKSTTTSNPLRVFDSPEWGTLRTRQNDKGEILLCAADVCRALGYSNASEALSRHVPNIHIAFREVYTGEAGSRSMAFVTEAGLYSLILGSTLPTALRFREWVTSEVLPSIRRTGGYIPTSATDTDQDVMARALLIAQDTIVRREAEVERLQGKIDRDAAKVRMFRFLEQTSYLFKAAEATSYLSQAGYRWKRHQVFEWLEDHGWVYRTDGGRTACTDAVTHGWMVNDPCTYDSYGKIYQRSTPKLTGRGLLYMIRDITGNEKDQLTIPF